MHYSSGKKLLWLAVLVSIFGWCNSVFSFVEIEVFDPQDGSFLGRIDSASAAIPYRDTVLLKVTSTSSASKIRLEPLTSDCGAERLTVQSAPFEFLVHPLSAVSRCVLQFVGWQAPWNWVGSFTMAMSFTTTDDAVADDIVPELSQLELYNLDTNEYLGRVEQGMAAIPFAEVIGVQVNSTQTPDWVRLIPTNEFCGQRRRFDSNAPFQLKVFAESENRPCEFTIQALRKPRTLIGSVDVTIVFTNEAVSVNAR